MADVVQTTADMMQRLEDEIQAAKDGTLDPEKARIVLRGRNLQLKTAELNLQYQRLQRGKPGANGAAALLAGVVEKPAESKTESAAEKSEEPK